MLKKFKNWLYRRFLPEWCREDLMETNRSLMAQIEEYREENARLRAYIDGMQAMARRHTRIVINAKEVSRA